MQMYDKYNVKYVQSKQRTDLLSEHFRKPSALKVFDFVVRKKVQSAGFSLKLFHSVTRPFEELATNFLESPRSEFQKTSLHYHTTGFSSLVITFTLMYPDRDTF